MNNKINIEEDIKILEEKLKQWEPYKNIKFPTEIEKEIAKENNAIENILADRERLEKENEELMKVKISASANTIISDLQKELNEENNRCAKFAVENNELQAKANKYDSLIEKIKDKINELKEIRKTKYYRAYGLDWESREQQDIDKQIEVLQELLDTEKQ